MKKFKEQFGLPIKAYLDVKLITNSEIDVKNSEQAKEMGISIKIDK